MEKPVSSRNTKNEILDAYEGLLQKVKEQSKQKPQEVKETE